jgi:formylglycine-generating enzyme required for sulfatase activity
LSFLNFKELEGQNINERTRITRYRAAGVYGYVFEADVLSLGRSVGRCAVKLVHARSIHSPEALLEDLRKQAQMVHPCLLSIQSSGLIYGGPADGWIYLTTELADITLQELLDRGQRMGPPQAREMLIRLCEAVSFLHSKGVTHGDIRPSNLLLTSDGWKLSGVEYRGMYGRRLEEVGPVENLFVFRAPETFDRPVENPAVDVWSIGVVMHACLTGGLPFAEANDLSRNDMLWKIANQDPEPEELGDPFDMMAAGCLRRDPCQRWSIEQALSTLTGLPIPSRADSSALEAVPIPEAAAEEPPASPEGRKRSLLFGGAGLLIFGVALGFALTPKPVKMVTNVKRSLLAPLDFQQALIDAQGRMETGPAKTQALREDLGDGVSLEAVEVKAGSFAEGSSALEPRRGPDEGPRHQVQLDTFYMSRREISQAQWARVASYPAVEIDLSSDPSHTKGQDAPVQNVSYEDAVEFCRRLSRKVGRVYRLPTEAEWEYACRGGLQDQPFGYGATLTDEVANFRSNRPYLDDGSPGHPIGRPTNTHHFKVANGYGLVDMHGNLKEWCLDYYGPYSGQAERNPEGPMTGSDRVVRGGSFQTYAAGCRSAARSHAAASERREDLGFRVVAGEQAPELARQRLVERTP